MFSLLQSRGATPCVSPTHRDTENMATSPSQGAAVVYVEGAVRVAATVSRSPPRLSPMGVATTAPVTLWDHQGTEADRVPTDWNWRRKLLVLGRQPTQTERRCLALEGEPPMTLPM